MDDRYVQIQNPRTKHYILIDRKCGIIKDRSEKPFDFIDFVDESKKLTLEEHYILHKLRNK